MRWTPRSIESASIPGLRLLFKAVNLPCDIEPCLTQVFEDRGAILIAGAATVLDYVSNVEIQRPSLDDINRLDPSTLVVLGVVNSVFPQDRSLLLRRYLLHQIQARPRQGGRDGIGASVHPSPRASRAVGASPCSRCRHAMPPLSMPLLD